MKRGRFSEEQMVGILKEHEAGRKVAELAREHGVSEATLYGWKSKYGRSTRRDGRWRSWPGSTASARRRCMAGRVSTAGWRLAKRNG